MLMVSCDTDEKIPGDGTKVYVAFQSADKVGIFNGSTGDLLKEVSADIDAASPDRPHFVVIDEVGQKWYLTLISSGYVAKYDLLTDVLEDTVFVGSQPALMALAPDGQSLYVSRFMPMMGSISGPASTEIQQINTQNMTISGAVEVGVESPHGIAMDPLGEYVWVTSFGSSCLFKIAVDSFDVTGYEPESYPIATTDEQNANAPACRGFTDNWANALQVVLSADGSMIFVSLSGRSQVRSFDAVTGQVLETYAVGTAPWHLAVTPDDDHLFVANRGGDSVSMINLSSTTNGVETVNNIDFDTPHGVAVSGDGKTLYISSSGDNSALHLISTATGELLATTALGNAVMPTGLAVIQNR